MAATLVLAPFVALHLFCGLNIFPRPRLTLIVFSFGLLTFLVLCLRAVSCILRFWGDPSARILRFASIGLLALSLPYSLAMYFAIAFLPPED